MSGLASHRELSASRLVGGGKESLQLITFHTLQVLEDALAGFDGKAGERFDLLVGVAGGLMEKG